MTHPPYSRPPTFAKDGIGLYKQTAKKLEWLYQTSPVQKHKDYAYRINRCGPTRKHTWYCRVKLCPVCMWRRYKRWQARFYFSALPALHEEHPNAQFLLLTLTVKNVKIKHLRWTVHAMAEAWHRLTQLRAFSCLGWIRALEVTRTADGLCHPHYHCLLMVSPLYFRTSYLTQHAWGALWQQCLRVSYTPVVDVRKTRAERFSYLIKPLDLSLNTDRSALRPYVFALTDHLHKIKLITAGGTLKRYLQLSQIPREITPSKNVPLHSIHHDGYKNQLALGEEIFPSADLSPEEKFLLIDSIAERLQRERGLSRTEALALIKDAM